MTIQPLYPAILEKSLKALSVVTFSTSSGVVSYTIAKRFAVSMTNAHVLTMNARSADSMTNGHALPVTERSTFAKATPMPRAKANGRINSKTAVPRRSSAAIGMSLSRPPSHRTTLRRTRKNPSGIFLPRRRRSANAARLLQRDKTGISINRTGSVMS